MRPGVTKAPRASMTGSRPAVASGCTAKSSSEVGSMAEMRPSTITTS